MTSRHAALLLGALALFGPGCRRRAEPVAESPSPSPAPPSRTEPEPAAAPGVAEPAPARTGAAALEFAELNWRAASRDGAAVVEQTGGPEGCRAAARRQGAELWSVVACLATRSQLPFVSPDGLRLLVIDPLPDHAGPDWSGAVAALLFEKGALLRTVAAGDMVAAARISNMVKDFSWLSGAGDSASPARYAAEGKAVAFRTVDGRTVTLAFDGGNFPTPRPSSKSAPEPAPQSALPGKGVAGDPEEGAVYAWEDGEGNVHYGHRFEIPDAYRKQARPVDASVGSMSVEPVGETAAGETAAAVPSPAAKPRPAPAPPPPPKRPDYPSALDLANGRISEDRPPDPKCRTDNGVRLCNP